jgi:hypothetical protein
VRQSAQALTRSLWWSVGAKGVVSAVQWVSTGKHNYTGLFTGVRRLLACSSDLNLLSRS